MCESEHSACRNSKRLIDVSPKLPNEDYSQGKTDEGKAGALLICSQETETQPKSETSTLNTAEEGRNEFISEQSQNVFENKSRLTCHIRINTSKDIYECSRRTNEFKHKKNLSCHRRSQNKMSCKPTTEDSTQETKDANKDSFSLCSRKINTQDINGANVCNTAETQQNALCYDHCLKVFTSKSNFKRHIRTHTGEKPFDCSHCGKAFSFRPALVTHFRIHSGEKPYKCAECGRTFSDRSNYGRHVRSHIDRKSFTCEKCHKRFLREEKFLGHCCEHAKVESLRFDEKTQSDVNQSVHSGGKKHICVPCPSGFQREREPHLHANIQEMSSVSNVGTMGYRADAALK